MGRFPMSKKCINKGVDPSLEQKKSSLTPFYKTTVTCIHSFLHIEACVFIPLHTYIPTYTTLWLDNHFTTHTLSLQDI